MEIVVPSGRTAQSSPSIYADFALTSAAAMAPSYLLVPIQAGAREETYVFAIDAKVDAIAIELQLVGPTLAFRGFLGEFRQLGRDEGGRIRAGSTSGRQAT